MSSRVEWSRRRQEIAERVFCLFLFCCSVKWRVSVHSRLSGGDAEGGGWEGEGKLSVAGRLLPHALLPSRSSAASFLANSPGNPEHIVDQGAVRWRQGVWSLRILSRKVHLKQWRLTWDSCGLPARCVFPPFHTPGPGGTTVSHSWETLER